MQISEEMPIFVTDMTKMGIFLFCFLLSLPISGQTRLPDESQDINEVTLVGEMIRLDDLALAEDLLQTYGWQWKSRNYETVQYNRIGNYKASIFWLESVSPEDRRLSVICFTTTTSPQRLIESMRRIGFKMTGYEEDTVYFEQMDGDITAKLDVDMVLPSFSMFFEIR